MTYYANYTPPSTIIFCMLLLGTLIFCAATASARDTITPGNPISAIYGETLISAGNKFQLGFFAFYGDSGGVLGRYVGIWYYMSNPQTIVWVANRDNPLYSPTGIFAIAEDDGNLKVMDGHDNSSYFSTELQTSSPSSSNRTVKLLDSGNLVLSDDLSRKVLWQSFDYPTDTFLPGMKMDEKLKLISWKRVNDPGKGNFTFMKDQGRENHYIILKRTIITYWRSGESGSFDSSDQMPDKIASLLTNFSATKSKYSPTSTVLDMNARLVMSSSGKLQFFDWKNGRGTLIWSEPRDKCSEYNACGDFGSCNSDYYENGLIKYCKCLPGFEPFSPTDWNSGEFSGGCTRKTTTCSATNYTFLNLKMMKVSSPDSPPYSEAASEGDCESRCLSECNCQAYSYKAAAAAAAGGNAQRGTTNSSSGACWIWTSNLRNLHEHMEGQGAHNLSVRVAVADIGESKRRNCKTCGTNLLPYPLSTGQNCGDPMYNHFRCNDSTGLVEFHEPSNGVLRVISINPVNHSFIIQRTIKKAQVSAKKAEICRRAANSRTEVFRISPSLPYKVISIIPVNNDNICNAQQVVEISWYAAQEPTCNSLEDCKDWPNSSCDITKRRCVCNANYYWDGLQSNCTTTTTNSQGIDNNPRQLERSRQKKKSFSLLAVIVFTVVMIVVLLCIGSYIWYRRRKLKQRQESRANIQGHQTLQLFDTERRVKNFIDSGDFKDDDKKGIDVPFFDLQSILAATKNFSDENKLGQGGFGPVYKGIFPGGQEIAVKRLSSHSGQGLEEFKNEVVLIAKLQHRNLVRLLGYCIEGDEKILLYEYMPNKSLDSFIFVDKLQDRTLCISLDWEKRFDIILGIARGLLYLHHDSRLRIIHRDLKTSNILLDEEMNPKISDFGLARIVVGKETTANTNRVVGTYGYMSPEYALDGLFSIKSDVFSFGVIVLEIVSGKRNIGFYKSQQAFNLLGHAWRNWREETTLDLMDQALLESCNSDEVMKCIIVGLLCVQEDPIDRPSMPNVVFMLGSETATLPNPKQPAFMAKKWLSSTPSSSSKPETISNSDLTIYGEDGR